MMSPEMFVIVRYWFFLFDCRADKNGLQLIIDFSGHPPSVASMIVPVEEGPLSGERPDPQQDID
jgi:hypothetical protein